MGHDLFLWGNCSRSGFFGGQIELTSFSTFILISKQNFNRQFSHT